MRVTQLWRFPVKSMGGEQVERCQVGAAGLEGDRRWGVRDCVTGNVLTARREPRLLMANARCDANGGLIVTLPDGTETDVTGPIAAWLDRDVELVAAGAEGGVYEVPLDFERETDWVAWQGPPEALHDSDRARVSLLSLATAGEWDVRRFRSNVVLDSGGEDDLVGGAVEIGSARLDVVKPIDRCVMVTRPQPGLEKDLDVLRMINRDRGGNLAVGALVARAGLMTVGDELRPVAAI